MSQTNQNIYPKSCVYNCGVQIYWNTASNEYWEVFTKKKHICPNRVSKQSVTNTNTNNNISSSVAATTAKPQYYSKKPGFQSPKCPIPSSC